MNLSLEAVKAACALVRCGSSQGTGYLIHPSRLLTCWHVVEQSSSGEHISLAFFQNQAMKGTVEHSDAEADWAIIRLDAPVSGVHPLRVGEKPTTGDWVSFGFPRIAGGQGVVLEGSIRDGHSSDVRTGRPQMQLHSSDAAAGRGPRLDGFSGSPVIARGVVIGHLKRVLRSDIGGTELGLIFACPASAYLEKITDAASTTWTSQSPAAEYDPLWYIRRAPAQSDGSSRSLEDIAITRLSDRGAPVVIQAPEQFGKSWTVNYLRERLQQQDLQQGTSTRVIYVDIGKAIAANPTPPTAAQILGLILHSATGQAIPPKKWEPLGEPGSLDLNDSAQRAKLESRFRQQFDRIALKPTGGLVILIIDGIDRLFGIARSDIVFARLRAMAEDVTPLGKKLRILSTVSIDPAFIEQADHSSFFALSAAIELQPFRSVDLEECALQYRVQCDQKSINALHAFTSGHPFLTRQALYEAVTSGRSLENVIPEVKSGSLFKPWLRNLQNHLSPVLLRTVRTLAQAKGQVQPISESVYNALYQKGLVLGGKDNAQIRSPVIRQHFKK